MICWAATILVFVGEGAGSLGAEFSGFFQKDTLTTIPNFFLNGVFFLNKFA
jgi:hypothetical protein